MSFNPFLNAKGALYNLYENAPTGIKIKSCNSCCTKLPTKTPPNFNSPCHSPWRERCSWRDDLFDILPKKTA